MNRKTLVGVMAIALGVVAVPASAHVTVNPSEAPKGSFAKLTFRVPNERPDAGTTRVDVSFPVEHPLAHLNVKPLAGWTYTIERQKLATPIKSGEAGEDDVTEYISKITWEGGTIAPGEFQEFEISGGPLPEDVDEIVFKAVQTYDSGEVVRWIEEAGTGGEEPEFPAPVLSLVAAGEDHHAEAPAEETTGETTETTAAEEEQAGATTDGGGNGGNTLAMIAVVVAGLALAVSGGLLLRDRPGESSS
ncbi:MAG: YcnI family protein [Acidimicrobiia bacterium]